MKSEFKGKTREFQENKKAGSFLKETKDNYSKNYKKNRARGKMKKYSGEMFDLTGLTIFGGLALWGFTGMPWFCLAAIPFLVVGAVRAPVTNRMYKYYNVIGDREQISVMTIAEKTGENPNRVAKELALMEQLGCFPEGYFHYKHNVLVLTDKDIEIETPYQQVQHTTTQTAQESTGVLHEIRAVNDEIENKKLSAQVEHIERITGKILKYKESNPDKSDQLDSFLSYYLPTTLKILRAYATLEEQAIEGENIKTAMERIEAMMDKVVEGFEKQLDQLFQSDTMDVTSDILVLEQMLSKDGLTSDGAFRNVKKKSENDLKNLGDDISLKL